MPAIPSVLRRLAACALVVVFGACNAADGVETVRVERSGVEVAPVPTTAPSYEHPLTGIRYDGPQDWQDRPTLALKVENTEVSRPQTGLEEADLVYEELVEGGITRFVAVFNSRVPATVGPVRSARMVDPDVLAPLDGLFGYSGAVAPVINAVRRVASVTDVRMDEVPDAYYRISSRESPHNLYVTPRRLWTGHSGSPPEAFFSFRGQGDDTSGGERATEVRFSFAEDGESIRYSYDPAHDVWRRFNDDVEHTSADGLPIAPTNVLIQRVQVHAGSITDAVGLVTPEADVFGSGEAILFSGGRVVHGRWERSGLDEPTRFIGPDGEPLELGRGQTFVELLPAGRDIDVE